MKAEENDDVIKGLEKAIFCADEYSNKFYHRGKWITPRYDDGMSEPIYYQVRCSKCGFGLDPQTWLQELHQSSADNYCPKCGAKIDKEDEKENGQHNKS